MRAGAGKTVIAAFMFKELEQRGLVVGSYGT